MTPEQTIQANAALVLQTARQNAGPHIDLGLSGAIWLDAYVNDLARTANDTSIRKLPDTLGSFLGECIRAEYGGKWVRDAGTGAWAVQVDEHITVFPFAKVEKQLSAGEGESVLGLFSTIEPLRRVAAAPADAAKAHKGATRPLPAAPAPDVPLDGKAVLTRSVLVVLAFTLLGPALPAIGLAFFGAGGGGASVALSRAVSVYTSVGPIALSTGCLFALALLVPPIARGLVRTRGARATTGAACAAAVVFFFALVEALTRRDIVLMHAPFLFAVIAAACLGALVGAALPRSLIVRGGAR